MGERIESGDGRLVSQFVAEPLRVRQLEVLEASRVEIEAGGEPVLVQWSFAYEGAVSTAGGDHGRRTRARLDLRARLRRGAVVLAEWPIASGEAEQMGDNPATVRVSGVASAVHLDQPPAPGPIAYSLEVWNAGRAEGGIAISQRTMVCQRP